MFPEFDLNSWTGSLAIVLVMGGIITGFSAALTTLICRMWGEDDAIQRPREDHDRKDSFLHKAA